MRAWGQGWVLAWLVAVVCAGPARAAPPTSLLMLVYSEEDRASGEVRIADVHRIPAPPKGKQNSDFYQIGKPAAPGKPALRFFDRSGAEVARYEVPTRAGDTEPPKHFMLAVPDNPRFAGVAFEVGGVDRAKLVASKTRPKLRITTPKKGSPSRECEIAWEASDADGDELRAKVQLYDVDDGYLAPAAYVAGVSRLDICNDVERKHLRVSVSDGFFSAFADMSALGLPRYLGRPRIHQPDLSFSDDAGEPGATFGFRAVGGLSGAKYYWSSDRDGLLGEGKEFYLPAPALSGGPHEITLDVVNINGTLAHLHKHVDVIRTGPAFCCDSSPVYLDVDLLLTASRKARPPKKGVVHEQTLQILNRGNQTRMGPILLVTTQPQRDYGYDLLGTRGQGWQCSDDHGGAISCTYAGSIEAAKSSEPLVLQLRAKDDPDWTIERDFSIIDPWARPNSAHRAATGKTTIKRAPLPPLNLNAPVSADSSY